MTTALNRIQGIQPEFQLGGPTYRLMQRVGLIRGAGPSIGRRIVGFLLITWVPLLVFALIEDRALGPTPRESFLLDFATYARFFLAVPLLFFAEVAVGPQMRRAALQFVEGELVRPADLPAFTAAVARADRRREALLPELVILGIAMVGSWFSLEAVSVETGVERWSSLTGGGVLGLSLTALWYQVVAVPILQFFALRWLWRLLSWVLFLLDLTRLRLSLIPTHPDRAGGLGFLADAHVSLAIFPLAFGCIVAGHAAFQIVFEGVPIDAFYGLFLFYLGIMVLICVAPMLVFVPQLAQTRRLGLRRYSLLADEHNRAFEEKWVSGQRPPDQALLGSSDVQSLADLGQSFTVIREMRPFPFSLQQVLRMAIIIALPGLPLVFLVMPFWKLLQLLAGALM
jgi:hypothetical protein